MGLSPKPAHSEPTRTWEDLDRFLQDMFSEGSKSKEPTVVYIDPDKYVMSTDEILDVGVKSGYTVSIHDNGQIKFE